jgi:hypothetical protein
MELILLRGGGGRCGSCEIGIISPCHKPRLAFFLCNIGTGFRGHNLILQGGLPHREITFSSVTIFLLLCVCVCVRAYLEEGMDFKRMGVNEGEIHPAT